MTNAEVKKMAASAAMEQQYHNLLEKLTRLQQQLDGMRQMGADMEWLELRWLEVERQKRKARNALAEIAEQVALLQELIDQAPDPMMAQILYLRYKKGHTWQQVAQQIGGMNTEDGVRKRARRYLQKIGENTK